MPTKRFSQPLMKTSNLNDSLMTKEQLFIKITTLGLVLGICGGMAQALGAPEHSTKWLAIGLLTGFAVTLHGWYKVAAILIAEYKRLKKLESGEKDKGCTEK